MSEQYKDEKERKEVCTYMKVLKLTREREIRLS